MLRLSKSNVDAFGDTSGVVVASMAQAEIAKNQEALDKATVQQRAV